MAGSLLLPATVGDLDTAGLATDAALAAHEADTTSIHGITNTANLIDASDTASVSAAGIIEVATVAETDAGTDATRAVSPDGLAGSVFGVKEVLVEIFAGATAWSTGDGKSYFPIPPSLNGMNLVDADATALVKSTSGTPTVQIARGRRPDATTTFSFADMLSTAITIDENEFDSATAATPPAINASNDDVATGDLLRMDVDVAGTGTTGGWVRLAFQLP